jgi:hypothetical protein
MDSNFLMNFVQFPGEWGAFNELGRAATRERIFIILRSLFISGFQLIDITEDTGAPSKAHTRQLVKIQHEERLATTSEPNPTPSLATD